MEEFIYFMAYFGKFLGRLQQATEIHESRWKALIESPNIFWRRCRSSVVDAIEFYRICSNVATRNRICNERIWIDGVESAPSWTSGWMSDKASPACRSRDSTKSSEPALPLHWLKTFFDILRKAFRHKWIPFRRNICPYERWWRWCDIKDRMNERNLIFTLERNVFVSNS